MNLEDQEKPQTMSCLNCQSINDENNNFRNSICTNCERKNDLEEKKNERMIIVPDTSSDDEYWCSSCSSNNDSELLSLDTKKLWHDIAHMIKCIYRETNREYTEKYSSDEISKAKETVQILTQLDPESLFNKFESIVLEYVDEIRNQVLKRFQTCLKTSNDVQLFISYLLDEYSTFIQAAKNVSIILSYLEDNYMKKFHLTWLLYNKHLYEKLVYMDKKIQHSMSTMIDLLQPSNDDDNNDYSPAEYTQLLNRFLAFDEEMSEIACLYKDSQIKMKSLTSNHIKKKICKKTKRIQSKENLPSPTIAVNIPISTNLSTIPITYPQGSNSSSISSGIGGKESSSISSFDEYLIDNNTSSSSYTKDESDLLNKDKQKSISTKKSKSNRRKDPSTTTLTKKSLTPDFILPPKPPSSTGSKLQADFRSLTKPNLSSKIQSVSFTAGTFGSITTTNESPSASSSSSSTNHTRLNLNLSNRTSRTDSTIAYNNLDQLLRQAASPDEISALLASLETTKSNESTHDKTCEFCCCDLFPESNSCVACMALANPPTITCGFNTRDIKVKERLKITLNKRTVQNPPEQSTIKPKIKPCDNNIDDLVRFIDGNDEPTTKKTRKKKDKQIKPNEDTNQKKQNNNSQTLSKRKQKAKLKLEQQEAEEEEEQQQQQDEQSAIIKPPTPPITVPSSLKKTDPISTSIDSSVENSIPPEEEVNWITISRKQTKHKPSPTPVPSLLSAPIVQPNNTKQKRQKPNPKTTNLAQQKVISETVTNSNKQQHTTNPPPRAQNPVKNNHSQQQKSETPSAWVTQVTPSSTLLATTPAFVPSKSNQINNVPPLENPSSSPYWDPSGYILPPGPVQRPISSFSPAPGPLHTNISRCIQRPTSEPRTTDYPMNEWKYPSEESIQSTTNDFPLYDPFNSGAGLTISSSTLLTDRFQGLEHFGDLNISQNNDLDEMDALDKEIEAYKKSCIDNILLDPREKVAINNDHRFNHQS